VRRRRTSREVALRALFQVDVGGLPPQEALDFTATEGEYGEEVLDFARQLVAGSEEHRARLDEIIEKYARGWTIARMANVDRNILRLAVFELLFMPDIPPSVAVDEAVELAKKYSTAESGRFVNGILGNLVRNLEAERGGGEVP
jgi:transcription antitermination protein NusB